jgi:hypothetical protein
MGPLASRDDAPASALVFKSVRKLGSVLTVLLISWSKRRPSRTWRQCPCSNPFGNRALPSAPSISSEAVERAGVNPAAYPRFSSQLAISRAQALVIAFANPRLLEVPCRAIKQMRLLNALCAVDDHDMHMMDPQAFRVLLHFAAIELPPLYLPVSCAPAPIRLGWSASRYHPLGLHIDSWDPLNHILQSPIKP